MRGQELTAKAKSALAGLRAVGLGFRVRVAIVVTLIQ